MRGELEREWGVETFEALDVQVIPKKKQPGRRHPHRWRRPGRSRSGQLPAHHPRRQDGQSPPNVGYDVGVKTGLATSPLTWLDNARATCVAGNSPGCRYAWTSPLLSLMTRPWDISKNLAKRCP